MGKVVNTELEKIAGASTKDGTYIEMQGMTRYDKFDEVVPYPDGETTWYRIVTISPTGLLLSIEHFGPEYHDAYEFLRKEVNR